MIFAMQGKIETRREINNEMRLVLSGIGAVTVALCIHNTRERC